MNRITLFTLCAVFGVAGLSGCQPQAQTPEAAEIDSLQLSPSLAISEKHLDEPLTEDEVNCFIELVGRFPGGKVPELSQVPGGVPGETRTPEELVQASRNSIRESLTVETLMRGWSPTTSVRRTIQAEQIEPRAMVSLMLRLSCAVAADAIGSPRAINAQRAIADEKVDALIDRVHRLRQAGRSASESLLESLHENAAMAEYLAILSEIPIESQQQVADHRAALQAILPANSKGGIPLEDREESHISPVTFETIDNSSPPRRPNR